MNLFDLRCRGKTILTLQKLYEAGIDVLTNDYCKHNNQRFSEIKGRYLEYCKDIENPYIPKAIRLIEGELVNRFFRSGTHSLLGQLLTDYSNGFCFKEELMGKGYEGYIFEEEQSSPTICLLCADKLSQPSHQVIYKK